MTETEETKHARVRAMRGLTFALLPCALLALAVEVVFVEAADAGFLLAATLAALALLLALASIQARSLLRLQAGSQRSLAARADLYRGLVEGQAELVSLAREDGVLTYVNPAYAARFGKTAPEIVGRSLFDFVARADRDAVRAQIERVLRGDAVERSENRMGASDGRECWVSWTNRLQVDADGSRLLHSVGRDVTDRKAAEQALGKSERFLARTGRVAGVGGWEVELPGGAVTWSEETRRIHEVGPEFVPTLETAIHFYAPESRPLIEAAVEAGIRDGAPWDLELRLVTATGRSLWVRTCGEVDFVDGVVVRIYGAFQDVTERRSLERRVADSERFIRQITDSLPIRISYVDRDARFRFVNEVHCRRFGRSREEIIGRTRSELTGGAIDATMAPFIAGVLGGEPQRFEYTEEVDGELRCIESQMQPDIDESGRVQGFYGTGIDITERVAAERALRDLTEIFDNTTDYIVQADERGRIHYLNPAVRRVLGMEADAATGGRSFTEFNTPETNQRFVDEILPAVRERGVWVGETTVLGAEGEATPVNHMVIAHRDPEGRVQRYSAVMRNISNEVEARHQLALQTATLQSVAEAIPTIVAVVGADRRYRFVNGAFERWIGRPRERVVGRTLEEVLSPNDAERSRQWVTRALAGEAVSFERNYLFAGDPRHMAVSYIPLRRDDGMVEGFVGVVDDISRHKAEEGRLLKLVEHDPLTGLLNRLGFERYMDRRMEEGAGVSLALLYIDLDRFKPVNDAHGHPVGDQLLRLHARRLSALVRPSDAVARLGGDEFAIALPGLPSLEGAQAIAEKVLQATAEPFVVGRLRLRIGCSIGVAFSIGGGNGWSGLVEHADAMLYRAKSAGRGRQAA